MAATRPDISQPRNLVSSRSGGHLDCARVRVAPRVPARGRGLRDLGRVPALLAAARAGRGRRDPGPPDPLVDDHHGTAGARARPVDALHRAVRRTPHPTAADRGRGGHRVQLGHVHLRRQHRPRGRGVAGLLHQPAGHRAHGRADPARDAARGAVGGARHRRRRRGGADRRLRAAAVDRAGPGLLLRHLRPGQEAGQLRGGRDPSQTRYAAARAASPRTGSGTRCCSPAPASSPRCR